MRKEVKILLAIAAVVVVSAVAAAYIYQGSGQNTQKSTAKPTGTPVRVDSSRLVRPDSPTIGPANAPVTLVEFFDPECESCRAFNPVIKKALKDYEGKIRLVVRYMPNHSNSMLAAQVLEAAGEQGKFWQMQELLLQKQQEWGEKREPQTELFRKYATEIGMNVGQMDAAISLGGYTPKIERDRADGQAIGATRTPTIFVNGRVLGTLDERQLRSLIDDELAQKNK